MYRGIIQDAPWLSPGPRKFIKESGLAEVNQRGRIWRIRKPDWKQPAAPAMLSQSTRQLVSYLGHANGWWRDTAQRLIVLRSDRDSVVPVLKEMVTAHSDPLARLHALWTLEGIGASDVDLLQRALSDHDQRVRCAATQICEPFIAKNDPKILESLNLLAATESEGDVAKQMILSLGVSKDNGIISTIDTLLKRHFTDAGVCQAACLTLWKNPSPFMKNIRNGSALESLTDSALRSDVSTRWTHGFAQWDRGLKFPKGMDPVLQRSISSGEKIFYTTCVACHGADGKGTGFPGTDLFMAPALAGSERVRGPLEGLLPVFVNGLTGPIKGRTYQAGFMAPAAALGITRDDRLADVLNYIRFAWDNGAGPVSNEQVKAAKQRHSSRINPWTDEELKAIEPEKP